MQLANDVDLSVGQVDARGFRSQAHGRVHVAGVDDVPVSVWRYGRDGRPTVIAFGDLNRDPGIRCHPAELEPLSGEGCRAGLSWPERSN